MTSPTSKPTTIVKIGFAAYPAFAMVAGMQLDLFTPLGNGPMTAEQLAESLGVKAAKLIQLLYALVTVKLLTVEDGLFANTPEAEQFLVRGKPTYLGGRHAFYTTCYQAAMQTATSIRSGCPQGKLDFAVLSPDAMEKYLRGLHPTTKAIGRDLASRFDFSHYHHLLDVGGGSGGLAVAIATACPRLRATVVDLPSVTPITQRFVEEEGMAKQIEVVANDVVRDPPTGSYDIAVLRAFIQILSPAEAQRALHHLIQVLEPGGKIHILGQVLDDSRLSPPETVAFNLVFLNVYDEGQAYTEHEYRTWLADAGFVGIERTLLTGGESLIAAYKPA